MDKKKTISLTLQFLFIIVVAIAVILLFPPLHAAVLPNVKTRPEVLGAATQQTPSILEYIWLNIQKTFFMMIHLFVPNQ